MSKHFLVIVALGGFVGLTPTQPDPAAEMKKLEGTWQLVSSITDGKEAAADFVARVRVVIKDGKHSVFVGDDVAAKEIPFVADPSKNPKTTVDTLPDGKQVLGIYKLENDTLTSCVAAVGMERPQEFASKAGSGHTLRVFKRVK